MAAGPVSERNQDATIYVGGLDEKVNEALLWELFVQAGPVVNVHMPKDRVTMQHQVQSIQPLQPCGLQLTPCPLHPAHCTLHPAPCTPKLHPTPYTLHHAPVPCTCNLHPTHCTLHPAPYTLHPAPCTLHPTPYTLHPAPCTPHLHPTPCTLQGYGFVECLGEDDADYSIKIMNMIKLFGKPVRSIITHPCHLNLLTSPDLPSPVSPPRSG